MPCKQQETVQVGAKLAAMNTRLLLIAAAFSAFSCSVFAQWQWMDEGGRKVFSDRPPPAHIAPQQILKRPPGAPAPAPAAQVLYPSAPATPAEIAAAQAQAQKEAQAKTEAAAQAQAQDAQAKEEAETAAHDKALEDAQRKAEEAEKKKQQAAQAKARQDNCARARASQLTLESGMRLAHTNEKGERGFLSEQQRQTDLQRAQKAIKDNCA